MLVGHYSRLQLLDCTGISYPYVSVSIPLSPSITFYAHVKYFPVVTCRHAQCTHAYKLIIVLVIIFHPAHYTLGVCIGRNYSGFSTGYFWLPTPKIKLKVKLHTHMLTCCWLLLTSLSRHDRHVLPVTHLFLWQHVMIAAFWSACLF